MLMRFWGGDPTVKVNLEESRFLISLLDPNHPETATCLQWQQKAEDCLEEKGFGPFKPYRIYDQVLALLNRIRHLLCRHLPADRLLPVLVQIRDGLDYLAGETERQGYKKQLHEIEQYLLMLATAPPPPPSSAETRFQLESISRRVASARESHWRKVNMLRTRLVTTAGILILLLLASFSLIPFLSDCSCVNSSNLLVMAIFGALGGLVSALRNIESLKTRSSTYYIQRTLLGLRPIVGAAAGVIVYLVQLSGLLSFAPESTCTQASHLILAFVAGFSERFFIAQIESIAGKSKPAGGPDEPKPSSTEQD